MCKWIMDSGATKHMTSCKVAFDKYEIIAPSNVHFGDDSIVEATEMGFIIVEVMVKDKSRKFVSKMSTLYSSYKQICSWWRIFY